ncbi:MAG: serine/threonine-protein phosphatase, partial [Dehalococcoidia bacterium]|nr:serine/threonine-protein phosphatase [Dehalococcoidia bacterium]
DEMTQDQGRIGLAVADVSDKGVPAALFMMSSRTLLKGAAIGHESPGDVLREVNDLLLESNEGTMFVTVLYAVYDPATRRFTYANGGHNRPLIIHADGTSTLLPLTGGIALGVAPDLDYEQNSVTLSPGDSVILYTDGVTEAMNGDEDQFGLDPLIEFFGANPPRDPEKATM